MQLRQEVHLLALQEDDGPLTLPYQGKVVLGCYSNTGILT